MSLNNNCGSLVTSGVGQLSYVVTDADKYQAAAFGLAQCQASGAQDCAVREQFCGAAADKLNPLCRNSGLRRRKHFVATSPPFKRYAQKGEQGTAKLRIHAL